MDESRLRFENNSTSNSPKASSSLSQSSTTSYANASSLPQMNESTSFSTSTLLPQQQQQNPTSFSNSSFGNISTPFSNNLAMGISNSLNESSLTMGKNSSPSKSNNSSLGIVGAGNSSSPWSQQSSNNGGGWPKSGDLNWKNSFDYDLNPMTDLNPSDSKWKFDGPTSSSNNTSTWSNVVGSHLGSSLSSNSKNYQFESPVSPTLPTEAMGLPLSMQSLDLNPISRSLSVSNSKQYCLNCEDKREPVAYCLNCNENLCRACVTAHLRVRLTRDHEITDLRNINAMHNNERRKHLPSRLEDINTDGESPTSSDLLNYNSYMDQTRKNKEFIKEYSKRFKTNVNKNFNDINMIEKGIDKQARLVIDEIKNTANEIVNVLKKKVNDLIIGVENLQQIKRFGLKEKKDQLGKILNTLRSIDDEIVACEVSGMEKPLSDACQKNLDMIMALKSSLETFQINEDDKITLNVNDFRNAIANFAFISGSSSARFSLIEGSGLQQGIVDKESIFYVITKDQLNQPLKAGGADLKVSIINNSQNTSMKIKDSNNGIYQISYVPKSPGDYYITVKINNTPLQGCPFQAKVRDKRNHFDILYPSLVFGTEGSENGELCRPWGVCCTKDGLIYLANRSNNRIEVFTSEGKFHTRFGVEGKAHGQFDRPSGICCDRMDRIIVADKDNHRIQIFTLKGAFLLAFGERGSKDGEFYYPWDVASNSKDQILVSDTRNHRVQLFSPNGEFILKYGFDNSHYKNLDSPRGVCFTLDDRPILTDFNSHRVLILDRELKKAQIIGKMGSENCQFLRPNGVAVDVEGNIIVSDSRNNRIQILNEFGNFIWKIGTKGVKNGELDQPCGVCVSPDGKIIVVDYGNSRIQIF